VAKKRTAKPTATAPARGAQPNDITIRGSAERKEWLDQIAAKLRTKPTQLIDAPLAEQAARIGVRGLSMLPTRSSVFSQGTRTPRSTSLWKSTRNSRTGPLTRSSEP
jgi:hypothetical protein